MGVLKEKNRIQTRSCYVQGKKIFYQENAGSHDDGTVVLFIHGAGGSGDVWVNQFSMPEKFRCLAVDLPGHGRSDGNPHQTLQDYSFFVKEFIKTLKLRSVILAGHSMGGGIVLECALADPEWLQGIILMDTGSRLRVKKEILDQLAQGFHPFDMIPYLYSPDCDPEVLHQASEDMKQIPAEVYWADFQACDAFDRSQTLQNIKVPALILCGAEDRMTPPKYAYRLHEAIPASQLVIISGAGHMSMLEQPQAVWKVIQAFANEKK